MKKMIVALVTALLMAALSLSAFADGGINNTPEIEIVYAQMRESENPVSGYTADESHCIELTACLNNKTSADIENALIIAALYEEEEMVAISCDKVSLSAKSYTEHNFKMEYKYSGDLYKKYQAKFFCLDGFEKLVPLSTSYESYYIPVEYLTTTDLAPWLKSYQFVSDANAVNGFASGGIGQSVWSLAVSPHDNDIILMGTNTVGIYRSVDGGDNFEYASEGLAYGCINDILFDPCVQETVYAICAPKTSGTLDKIDTYQNIGVYKSVDNGKTWEVSLVAKFEQTKLGGRKELLSFKYGNANYIIAGTAGSGIWRTGDCGETWKQVYAGTENIYDLCDGQDGRIVAAGENGLLVSNDGGETWTLEQVSVDGKSIILQGISVSKRGCWVGNTETAVYFKNETTGDWYKDSREISKLKSAKFSNFSDDLVYLMCDGVSRPFRYMFKSESSGIYKFITDAERDNKTFGGNNGYYATCYNSTDEGKLWYFCGPLIYSPDGKGLDKIVLKQQRVSGALMTDMHFDENGTPLVMSTVDMGLFAAAGDNGAGILCPTTRQLPLIEWDDRTSSSQIAVDPRDSKHMLAVTGHYGYTGDTAVAQSSDGFTTVEGQSLVYGNSSVGITVVEFHNQNPDIIYAGYKRSDDNGQTWKNLYLEKDNPETSDVDESVLANIRDMSKKNSDMLLAFKGILLYISSDRGETWTEYKLDLPYDAITCARFDLFDQNVIWISGRSSISKYNYVNDTLETKFDDAKKTKNIKEIAQNPNNKNHLLAINHDIFNDQPVPKLYESRDGGESWNAVEGIPALSDARYIVFHPVEPVAYLGTYMGTLVYDFDCYHKIASVYKDYK